MKIALLPSAYQPSIGGVEELTRQLALAYKAKGHEVIVVTNRWPRSLERHQVIDGIDVYRLPFRLPHPSLRGRLSYPLSNRAVERAFLRILRRHEIEVLHVQCVSSNAEYAMRAKRKTGVPLVVTTQGELTMDAAHAFERDATMIDIMRRVPAEADAVTACSSKTLADLEEFLGYSLPGAHVIHNGADTKAFATASPLDLDGSYVLGIGRFVPQKGFDLLLDAWAAVRPPGIKLLLVGEGADGDALQARCGRLGIGPSVQFYGPANRETVPRLFAGATAVVVPSRADEGLPLVAVEALAAGKPLIVTKTGGVLEAVEDGVSAIVVERGSAESLTEALRVLLGDPQTRGDLAGAAPKAAMRFDWSTLGDRYLDVLAAAAGNRSC